MSRAQNDYELMILFLIVISDNLFVYVTCYAAACCAVQTACDECSSLYKVNSITYCCPGCKGDVLVTGLICTCTVLYSDQHHRPNCTISNKVVGDYYSGRTSWYSAGNLPSVSTALLLITLCLVTAIRYWSGLWTKSRDFFIEWQQNCVLCRPHTVLSCILSQIISSVSVSWWVLGSWVPC